MFFLLDRVGEILYSDRTPPEFQHTDLVGRNVQDLVRGREARTIVGHLIRTATDHDDRHYEIYHVVVRDRWTRSRWRISIHPAFHQDGVVRVVVVFARLHVHAKRGRVTR